MENRSCNTCLFGIQTVNGKGEPSYVECRFNPPQAYCYPVRPSTPAMFNSVNIYPRMTESDWCFQYRKKVNK